MSGSQVCRVRYNVAVKKKAPEGAFLLCLVTGSNYPVTALRPLVRSFRLLLF